MVRLRRNLPSGVKDVMTDRFGRTVLLTEKTWQHILDGHPAMEGLDLALKRAVEAVDERRSGNREGVERLLAAIWGPQSGWWP